LFGICADGEDRFVEFNAGARRYLLVSPPVIDEQLTAVLGEGGKVGIEIVDVLIDCVRLGRVALKVEGPPVPF
jgi:hypothetical protein